MSTEGLKVQAADGNLAYVDLRRGDSRVQSKPKTVTESWATIEEELVFTTTMYSDKQRKKFLPKACLMSVYTVAVKYGRRGRPSCLASRQIDLKDLMSMRKEGTGAHGELSSVRLRGQQAVEVVLTPTVNYGSKPLPIKVSPPIRKKQKEKKSRLPVRSKAAPILAQVTETGLSAIEEEITSPSEVRSTQDAGVNVSTDVKQDEVKQPVTQVLPPHTANTNVPVRPSFLENECERGPEALTPPVKTSPAELKSPSVAELIETFSSPVQVVSRPAPQSLVIHEVEEHVETPQPAEKSRSAYIDREDEYCSEKDDSVLLESPTDVHRSQPSSSLTDDVPTHPQKEASPQGSETNSGDTDNSLYEAECVSSRRSIQYEHEGNEATSPIATQEQSLDLLQHVVEADFVKLNLKQEYVAQETIEVHENTLQWDPAQGSEEAIISMPHVHDLVRSYT